MIDVDFLKDVGFTVVAPHQHFPRLRLELDRGLGWKAEVEAALERLLESVQIRSLPAPDRWWVPGSRRGQQSWLLNLSPESRPM